MSKPSGVRHGNYEILNLVGYGLAKFEKALITEMGFETKNAFYNHLIARGVANTVGTLKNRQDLFNPLVRKAKVGWWQNGDKYLHRVTLLDSLFGQLDASGYAALVRLYLQTYFPVVGETVQSAFPILKSKFRQLQETGAEAEIFFMNFFNALEPFRGGSLEDARLFGDGYDFQISWPDRYRLVEVKGVRGTVGGIRLTEKEYKKAEEYKRDYCLAVVSRLEAAPRISVVFDPLASIILTEQRITTQQVFYTSSSRRW